MNIKKTGSWKCIVSDIIANTILFGSKIKEAFHLTFHEKECFKLIIGFFIGTEYDVSSFSMFENVKQT